MQDLKKLLLCSAVFILLLAFFGGVSYAAPASNQNAVITGNVVNLRQTADTSSKILTKLPKGTIVSVIKATDKWYNVSYDEYEGWVSGEYISLKGSILGTGVVDTEVLNLRSKPDTSSDIVSKLSQNDKVTLLQKSSGWYRIKNSDGDIGWVSGDFIAIRKSVVSRGDEVDREDDSDSSDPSDIAAPSGDGDVDSAVVQDIITYAKKFLGEDYVYGGDTPREGFDCSGFTKYVFAKFGVDLERTAADQACQGTKVTKANLRPGDLIFFDTNGGHNHINHVGMYIGNGRFIHASSPRTGVIITDLSDGYYQRAYMRSRRIISK